MQAVTDTHSTNHIRSYVTGFILAILLTAIPFGLVAIGSLSTSVIMPVIVIAAMIQVVVHLHYFLHLDFSPKSQWYVITILFTFLILVIMVGGTIWIIYDLNMHMMPR